MSGCRNWSLGDTRELGGVKMLCVGWGPTPVSREDTREPCGASGLQRGVSPEPLRSANARSNSGGGGVPAARIVMGPHASEP